MVFPKINDSKIKGLAGEACFEHFVYEELKCIYHKNSGENDYGIDGFIELVQNGSVTGKRAAVQIKHGDSFFANKHGNGYKFIGDNKHLNYYLNCGVPVFIIIMDTAFRRMRWVKFSIDKTMPAGEGRWWIEVPDKNDIMTNFREAVWEAAGSVIDFADRIEREWMLSEIIQNSDKVILAITKEEIEKEDFSSILNYIDRVSRNKEILIKSRNSLEICFPEYSDDTRELYQIPEVMRWLRRSVESGIPWFYFLNHDWRGLSLQLLLEAFCLFDTVSADDHIHVLQMDMEKYKYFLEINFYNLNCFMEKNELDADISIEITDGIVSYYSGWSIH